MSQGEFLVDLEWAAGTPLGQTTESVQMLDKRIRTVQGIDMVFALVGTSGQTGGSASDKKEHTAQLHLKLSGVEYEESVVSQVRSMLSDVPDLEYKFSRPSYFSFRTPIEVEISGYNIGTLKLLADEVMERLRGIEGLTDIRSSAEGGSRKYRYSLIACAWLSWARRCSVSVSCCGINCREKSQRNWRAETGKSISAFEHLIGNARRSMT